MGKKRLGWLRAVQIHSHVSYSNTLINHIHIDLTHSVKHYNIPITYLRTLIQHSVYAGSSVIFLSRLLPSSLEKPLGFS